MVELQPIHIAILKVLHGKRPMGWYPIALALTRIEVEQGRGLVGHLEYLENIGYVNSFKNADKGDTVYELSSDGVEFIANLT